MSRLVIGIGNPGRGDDAAGLEVARRLRTVPARERLGAGFDMIDEWEGADDVILVDAARSGAPAGTIHRFDATRVRLPATVFATSTHSMGVAQVVEVARALGLLPPRLWVYGIEATDFALGAGISAAVAASVQRLVGELDHA